MNRDEKCVYLDKIKKMFTAHGAVFLMCVDNLTVREKYDIAAELKSNGIYFLWAKNTLTRVVLSDYETLSEFSENVSGRVALVAADDVVLIAKTLYSICKKQEKIKFLCASYKEKFLSCQDINKYAKLASAEQIYGNILCAICSSASRVAKASKFNACNVVGILRAYSENKN